MDLPVYVHNGCPAFTRSPRLMLHHLRTQHASVTLPILATTDGMALLDAQISELVLAVAPPGNATHVCLTCDIILGTRFDADRHQSLPQHIVTYRQTLENTGSAGVKDLLQRRWIRITQKAEHDYVLAPVEPPPSSSNDTMTNTASPGQLRYLQSFYNHETVPRHTVAGSRLGTADTANTRGRHVNQMSMQAGPVTEPSSNPPVCPPPPPPPSIRI